jgi:hypothetical protein
MSPATGAAPTELVMIIGHGEKLDGSDPGIDAQGTKDDSSLTATGWERAKGLIWLFTKTGDGWRFSQLLSCGVRPSPP